MGSPSNKHQEKETRDLKKPNIKTKASIAFEEWKKIPLKQGELKEKIWGIKTYYYCNEHQAWSRHKEEDYEEDIRKERKLKISPPNKQSSKLVMYSQDDFLTTLTNIMTDE